MTHLLLLDDYSVSLSGLKAELAHKPELHVACTCTSIWKALQTLRAVPVDLILMDLYLTDLIL